MYKDIKWLGAFGPPTDTVSEFKLIDTDFTAYFRIKTHHAMSVSGMIREYIKRKLPVTSNIARHYLNLHNQYNTKLTAYIPKDRASVIEHYPDYDKYFDCIIRQIRQVSYGKYATPII